MLAVIPLIILFKYTFQVELCNFSTFKVLLADDAKACFETLGRDTTTTDAMYDNLIKYADISALSNEYKNPPAPYEHLKIDVAEELKKLKTKSAEYMYECQSHFDLIDLYGKLQNPNYRYIPPLCYYNTTFVLPFTIIPNTLKGDTSFTVAWVDQWIRSVYADMQFKGYGTEYTKYTVLDGLIGKRVEKIDGMPVNDFLLQFAKGMPFSKDIGTNVNIAIKRYFTKRTLALSKFPSTSYVTFLVASGTGGDVVTIPFIFFNPAVNSPVEFKSQCLQQYKGSNPLGYPNGTDTLGRDTSVSTGIEPDEKAREDQKVKAAPKTVYSLTYHWTEDYLDTNILRFSYDTYINQSRDRAVGVIVLGTFDLATEIEILVGNLKASSTLINKLVIDVRGNNGGNMLIPNYVPSWINSTMSQPNSFVARKKKDLPTEHLVNAEVLAKNVYEVMNHWNSSTLKDCVRIAEGETLMGVNYTGPFTEYNFDMNFGGDFYQTVKMGSYYEKIFSLDRPNVVVITDGECFGSCATLLWTLKDKHGATIVSVGGLKSGAGDSKPSFGSSGGSKSIWQSEIATAVADLKAQGLGHQDLPSRMPSNTDLVIPWYTLYSIKNMTDPLEFKYSEPDFHCFFYQLNTTCDNVLPDYPYILDSVFEVLDSHTKYSPEQVELDIGFGATQCNSTNHGTNGRRWDYSKQSYSGECAFMYCDDGFAFNSTTGGCELLPGIFDGYLNEIYVEKYYLTKDEVEAKYVTKDSVNKEYMKTDEVLKTTIPMAGAIATITLLVAAVIALIVLISIMVKRKTMNSVAAPAQQAFTVSN